VFQELKLKKKSKYIIFNLNKDKTEIVPVKSSSSKEYEEFLADLPENECRWAVYDLEFQKEEGGLRNKLVFYHWYVVFQPYIYGVHFIFSTFFLSFLCLCSPPITTHHVCDCGIGHPMVRRSRTRWWPRLRGTLCDALFKVSR
jgi:hypothetical protein